MWNRIKSVIVRDRKNPRNNRRIVGKNLSILAIFLFFIFAFNLALIVGTHHRFGVDLLKHAKENYQVTETVQAKRGTIYDRDGNPIAENATSYNIYAVINKKYVSSTGEILYVKKSQFNQVASIFKDELGMKKSYVVKQLKTKGVTQIAFGSQGNNITYSNMTAIKKALKKAKIEGIYFSTNNSRMYPNGQFASQFIGLAQSKENKDGSTSLYGATGLEASLNQTLSGTNGKVVYEVDKNGNKIYGTGKTVKKAVNGEDVYTTLSEPLQTYLETAMDAFQSEAGGVLASATVVNAKTGEILATTQRPTFNSDTKTGMSAKNFTWQSSLYQTNFEPGSTMKVMLLASAINNGTFNPNGTYSNASTKIYDTTIRDWDVNEGISSGRTMTYAQGFAFSSNVGMTHVEQQMGDSTWLNYLSKFRFGLPTRFGMGNEASGIVNSSSPVNVAMSAFGQGIAVTETQMLRAFTGISNNGVMLEPQFISKVVDTNNDTERVSKKEVVGNPVSKSAASQTRQYMVTVGTDPTYGTLYSSTLGGPIIKVGNEEIAVKSGTAQIADSQNGGYLTGTTDYIYSVVAMAPASDPDFIMYVTIKQPQHWMNTYWQTVVNPVLTEATYMKSSLMSSTKTAKSSQKETKYKLANLVGKSPGDTSDVLRRHQVHPVVLGTGSKIKKTSIKAGQNLKANTQLLLLTNKITEMPDMYGWTKKNVKTFAKWLNIDITIKGNKGTVKSQSVSTNTTLKGLKKMTVTLGG